MKYAKVQAQSFRVFRFISRLSRSVFGILTSESQLQPELNFSWRQNSSADPAEVGIAQRGIRIGEMRIIKGVEGQRYYDSRKFSLDHDHTLTWSNH